MSGQACAWLSLCLCLPEANELCVSGFRALRSLCSHLHVHCVCHLVLDPHLPFCSLPQLLCWQLPCGDKPKVWAYTQAQYARSGRQGALIHVQQQQHQQSLKCSTMLSRLIVTLLPHRR
jgi:hypothetical protein